MCKINRDYECFIKVASYEPPLEVLEHAVRVCRVVTRRIFYREECDDVCSVCGFSRVGRGKEKQT